MSQPRDHRRVDVRWARVPLAQLRDAEFLNQQLRRQETLAGARRTASGNRATRRPASLFVDGPQLATRRHDRALWTKLLKRRKPYGDDDDTSEARGTTPAAADEEQADHLLHALVLLGDLPQPTRAAYLRRHLQTQLARLCHVADPHAEIVALRRGMLRHVVDAVAVQHQHVRAATAVRQATVALVKTKKPNHLTNDPNATHLLDATQTEAAFAAELTMEVVGWWLELAMESGDTAAALATTHDVFRAIVRVVETLTPLSLARRRSPDGSGPTQNTRRLVRKLQQFLLAIAMGKSSSRDHSTARGSTEVDVADRTLAVTCLFRLAAAGGSVHDLLVVVCVLLGIGDDGSEAAVTTEKPAHSPLHGAASPRLLRVSHASTSPTGNPSRRPTRELVHRKEYESDQIREDERGDVPDEIANLAVEQRLRQVHKQRADQSVKELDAQTTAVDQLLNSHAKRKAGHKNMVVSHTKAAVANIVIGAGVATASNLAAHRVSVPHPPPLGVGKSPTKATKDDLNNLSLEADLTYSLDVTSSRSDVASQPSPRHAPQTMPVIIGPKLHPLHVGDVLKEIDQIKPTITARQLSGRQAIGSPVRRSDLHDHHDLDGSDDDHEVWSCGQNSYGELGHGDTNSRKSFERVEALQQKDIVQVSAGNEHTVVLSSDGTVWTCGYNDNGQCGQGVTTRINHLTEVQKLSDSPVVQVHAYNGCEHTVLVTQDGKAATCGYNYRGQLGHGNTQSESIPKIMRSIEGRHVRLVSCSYYHTAITCDSGPAGRSVVYTFGRNDYGQLGHGDTIDRKVPQSVEAMHDQHVVSIACGQYHTTAVTSSGKLFSFGKNDYGQLGVESAENQLVPVHVKHGLERQTCLEVRCGYYHSIVLCAGAHLFGFGRNDYGQLGLGKSNNAPSVNIQLQQQRFARPQLIEDLEAKEIVRFACGCYHTVAVSDNGVLYVFGRNNHGQLGTGDTNERLYPYPIDDFVGKRVALVAAGFYHTLVLTGGNDDAVDEEQDQNHAADENNGPSGVVNDDESSRPIPVFLTHGMILTSPVIEKLFQSDESRSDSNKAVHRSPLIPSAQTDAIHTVGEPRDPSSDGDAEDGRAEDRHDVTLVDGIANKATDGSADSRVASRATENEKLRVPLDVSPHGNASDIILVTLALLDRLCSTSLGRKTAVYPSNQQLPVNVVEAILNRTQEDDIDDLVDGIFENFSIEVSGSTFSTLCSLILQLSYRKFDVLNASSVSAYLSPRVTNGAPKLQAYLVSVCFRILQANFFHLVKSGLGNLLTVVEQVGAPSHKSQDDHDSGLSRLWVSVRQVRSMLLTLISKPKQDLKTVGGVPLSVDSSSGMSGRIVTDSIDTLMIGFDVFFPCLSSRLVLLATLLGSATKHEGDNCEVCQSIESHRLQALKSEPKRLFLSALLKRLAEDGAVSKLVFLDHGLQRHGPLTGEPNQILSDFIDVLLEYMNAHFVHTIGTIAVSYGRRGDDEPTSSSATERLEASLQDSAVILLNALQKHLATIANACERWTRQVNLDTKKNFACRVSALMSSAIRVGGEGNACSTQDFPTNWRGLIQLAVSILVQSSDTLSQGLSRRQPSPSFSHHPKRGRKDIFDDAEFHERIGNALESSIVGRVLPLLTNCLMVFSHIPAFAVSLMHPIQSVLRLLDGWNVANAVARRSDQDVFKNHLGKQLSSSTPNSSGLKSAGTARLSSRCSKLQSAREDSSLGLNDGTARVSVSESLDSPWSVLLAKEMSMLCAEFALTITSGQAMIQLEFGYEGANLHPIGMDAIVKKWQNSPLFQGGIMTDFVHQSVVVGSQLARTVSHSPISIFRHATTIAPSFLLTIPQREIADDDRYGLADDSHVDPALRPLLKLKLAHIRAFIREMALEAHKDSRKLQSVPEALCEWLRTLRAKTDPAYRMLLRQSHQSTLRQSDPGTLSQPTHLPLRSDAQLEQMFFAVLLHHHSLDAFALLVATCIASGDTTVQERQPLKSLLALWRVVADFRRRYVATRTAIKNSQASSQAEEAISKLQSSISDRCHMLLLVAVDDEDEHRKRLLDGGFVAPWDPALVYRSCLTVNLARGGPSQPRSHLSARYGDYGLPFLSAFPLSRWRRVRTLFHVVMRWKAAAATFQIVGKSSVTTAALAFVTADDTEVGDIHQLAYELLVEPCRQFSCTTRGYELLWELISAPQLENVRFCVIQHICDESIRLTTSVDHGLDPVSKRNGNYAFREMRRIAQNDFLAAAVQLMVEQARDAGLSSNESTRHRASHWVLLVLMRCIGLVTFTADQYDFVNDLGLVHVLEEMLMQKPDDDADKSGRTDSIRNMSLHANTAIVRQDEPSVQEAAWALTRSIILQLGSVSSLDASNMQAHAVPIYPVCYDVFDTLFMTAQRQLEEIVAPQDGRKPSLERARNNGGGSINNTIRRSFEIIVAPKHFSFLTKGLSFTYRQMIEPASGFLAMSPLVKPGEFSITSWIYAAPSKSDEAPTASGEIALGPLEDKQIVFVRGDGREISPYLLLVRDIENKWQLEVGVAVRAVHPSSLTPNRLLWERLNSKESLAHGRWSHIAIVVEGAKLRLYINGILDSQRSLSGTLATAINNGNVDLDFSFGRQHTVTPTETVSSHDKPQPEGLNDPSNRSANAVAFLSALVSSNTGSTAVAASPSNTKPVVRSFNGLLSHFRFHNRSLSPIHVRIVYDEKKPVKQHEHTLRGIYSRSSDEMHRIRQLHAVLRVMVESDEGRIHLADPAWARLLWEAFMSSTQPDTQLSSVRLLRDVLVYQKPTTVDESISQCQSGYSLIRHALQIIGNCISPRFSSDQSSLPMPVTLETRQRGQQNSAVELCDAAAERMLKDVGRGPISIELANELRTLLTELLCNQNNDSWRTAIWSTFEEVLGNSQVCAENRAASLMRLGCLFMVGGPAAVLTSGADVQVVATKDPATVIALEEAMATTPPEVSPSECSHKGRPSTTVYVSIRDHNHAQTKSHPDNWLDLVLNECATFKTQITRPRVTQPSVTKNDDADANEFSAFLRLHRDDVAVTEPRNLLQMAISAGESSSATIMNHLIEAASNLRLDNNCTPPGGMSNLLHWLSSGLVIQAVQRLMHESSQVPRTVDPQVLANLLDIASQDDSYVHFVTVDEVEKKLWVVRTRLYQILHGLEEQGEAEVEQWFERRKAQGVSSKMTSPVTKSSPTHQFESEDEAVEQVGSLTVVTTKLDLSLDLAIEDPVASPATGESRPSSSSSNGSSIERMGTHAGRDTGTDGQASGGGDEEDVDGEDDEEGEDGEDDDDGEEDEDEEEVAEHRQEFVDELMMMGFPEEWCILALKQTENDIVGASAWIVDNLEYLSRLQTSLDKQRDQSTDKLLLEDEDDVEGDEAFDENESTAADAKQPFQFFGASPHHRATSRQGSGVRSHPHSPMRPDGSHQHLINDKEMGRKIFGEMYFPFEDGGYESSVKDRFFTSWRTETNKGTALSPPATPGEVPDDGQNLQLANELPNRSDTIDEFTVKVELLDLSELLDHLAYLERAFLVLTSRQTIVTLLTLSGSDSNIMESVVTSHMFPTLVKLVMCRGHQFKIQLQDNNTVDVGTALRGLVSRLIRGGNVDLLHRLIDFAMTQLEDAASNPAYETVLWTQRELRRADRVVLEEPAVELAAWLFDVLFGHESIRSEITPDRAIDLIKRLRAVLKSSNLPVKFVTIATISRVLRQIGESQRLASADGSLSTLLTECRLDVESFLCAAKNRFLREQVQHRVVFSLYLQAYVEILFVLQRASNSELVANALPPPIPTSCLVTADLLPKDPTSANACHPILGFDRMKCRSSLLQIAEDGLSATYSGNELWKTMLATQSFATGVHEWHIRIDKSPSSYLFIGVASRRANLDSFLGADDHSWGFIGDKALYYQRNRLRVYGDNFGEGDIVGVHLNCELGTLGFSKNGVFLGVAFENLLDEVFPAVAFYSRHQKVSIILPDQPDDQQVCHSSTQSDGTVEEAVVVCEIMDSMVSKSPLPQRLVRAAYESTIAWWRGTGRHITTRSGSTLWVDVTKATCERFGFLADEQVRSPRGNGRVLGVADGRLWIQVDGESGAWHIHPSRLRAMSLSVVNAAKPDMQQPQTTPRFSFDGITTNGVTAKTVSVAPDSELLTQAEFATFSQDRMWSLQLDRAILNVINSHCETTNLSPWNVTPNEIIRIVQSKTHEIEQATSTAFSFGGNDGGRRLERKLVARYGFLRFFNAYFSRVIGFFDLTWQYFAPASGLLPCQLLSSCRGSIFTTIKNDFFTALLEKTSNSPKKSDDDYDYPEDLTQMLINRPKAATAKCHPGTTTSLMLSMFGQAFDELHFLPLRMLRMVYSHPMDDGQLRSFKVKFEGEGVDDYGGPYREFFSQFFAELQMLCGGEEVGDTKAKADANGSLGTSFLPFLMPSPNWRNGVGSSRERFILNGSVLGARSLGLARVLATPRESDSAKKGWAENDEVKRQLHSEMCHFLGQMIGIALRTRVCIRLDLAVSVWKQLVGEDQNKASVLADLKETDFAAHALLQSLSTLHETYVHPSTAASRRAEIEEEVAAMDLAFTTYLSDGRFVELCDNGGQTPVTMANLAQYLDLVLCVRMDECKDVVNVIKQGIHSIIPVAALGMLTWEELEKRICGVAEVDVELLKRNTEYDDDLSAQDEFIQRFWRVLTAMDDEDKRAFLRFVWARSRLPVGMAQFHQKFKIQSLAPSTSGNENNSGGSSNTVSSTAPSYADTQLPKSHTCFFALQLPRYSTDEICRKQLLYAIHNCVEMDGDFRLADAEMTGWTDVDPNDQLRF